MDALKRAISNLPLVGPVIRRAYLSISPARDDDFTGSENYWDRRYRTGRDSGAGSYSRLAQFKAAVLNRFMDENGIVDVLELGCGDGAQLALAKYPKYLGADVSPQAIERCRSGFSGDRTKQFCLTSELPPETKADVTLSLDVIYHLVEDEVFDAYMRALFDRARRFVVVYSSNEERPEPVPHVRHREFTRWVAEHQPDWELFETIKNKYPFDPKYPYKTSFADFYLFRRRS